MGRKARRKARRAKRKLARKLREHHERETPIRSEDVPAPVTGGGYVEPTYPPSAVAVQRAGKRRRRRRSPVGKKTIKAMHREVNRRIAAVGEEGMVMLDAQVSDQEKFVILERQCGNIGSTLSTTAGAGSGSAPELVHRELVRVMALAGLWAQSLDGVRRRP